MRKYPFKESTSDPIAVTDEQAAAIERETAAYQARLREDLAADLFDPEDTK